jgi:hypothetical protein
MVRDNFTRYDEYPEAMLAYLRNYGPHFNRKLYEFATDKMMKVYEGKKKKIVPYKKEEVDTIMKNYGIEVNNAQLYDCAYVASMCKADFLGSSVIDDRHLAIYVKDVIDDVDAPDGLVFNRWYADMCYMGIAIDWEEML